MSAQPSGTQYSPDGRFWWDGTTWRPVDGTPSGGAQPAAGAAPQPTSAMPASPAPAAASTTPYGPAGTPTPPYGAPAGQPPYGAPGSAGQPPHGAPGAGGPGQPPYGPAGQPPYGGPGAGGPAGRPGFPPPPGAAPSGSGRSLFVLALVGAVLVMALVGGLIGWIVGVTTTEPPGIEDPPEFAAEFPTSDIVYLPGVTIALVVDEWLKDANNWKCEPPKEGEELFSGAAKAIDCEPPDDDVFASVHIEFDADDKVRLVRSRCSEGLNSNVCITLASSLAHTVLTPQGEAARNEAEKWAKENAASERVTVISGVRLEAGLDPQVMEATPAA